MRNGDNWRPSKFVYQKGKLVASKDIIASRVPTNITASNYDTYIKVHCRGKLLDLGCGEVPLYEAYRSYVTDNTCVDWDNSLIDSDHLDSICDLTQELPFSDCQFDTIICSDVLEHIPNPEHLWLEMARVLRANGKILLNVPFYYWLHSKPFDYYRYTEYALRRFASCAGLEVLFLEATGGTPEILGDILAKHVVRVSRLGRLAAILIQAATLAFVKTGPGKKVSRSSGERFPFGYFMITKKT